MQRAVPAVISALLLIPRVSSGQGNPLGPEFRVNTFTTGAQSFPQVAVDSLGNSVVIWDSFQQDGSSWGVFGQRYDASGTAQGAEFRVNTYTSEYQLGAAVAVDGSGNFVVVWYGSQQDGSVDGVFGQRYASAGAPLGPEFRVNTYTTGPQDVPSVAADASGNFVVVWQEGGGQDGSPFGVFGQRYASSGAPLGSEFRVNTYTTGSQLRPAVAAMPSGEFVVVWMSYLQDGSEFGIFGQRYGSAGAPLGPEFRVNTYTPGYQRYPSVAASASGAFVVVWQSYLQDGLSWGVFGQRYASSGSPLGSEFRVNAFTVNGQAEASVAADAAGDFVVVWSSGGQDGYGGGVFGHRYASSGAPLGAEFRVNTYTTYSQTRPFVASEPTGNFVVVWSSYGQDGSNGGVFGQRFAEIVPVEVLGFSVE